MTSVLSDREDEIVAHLVENELASLAGEDHGEYPKELRDLLEKVQGEN